MAIVSDGFEGTITIMDSGGNTSSLTYKLVEAAVAADALADLQAILALLLAVTNGVLKSYTFVERFVQDTPIFPTAGVHVENRATVVAQLADNPLKTATVIIPAPKDGIFQTDTGPGSNIVDLSDADLLAYIDIWQETGALASISDGEFITDGVTALRSGKRTHRKSSKG
jgi:hypothetical protein